MVSRVIALVAASLLILTGCGTSSTQTTTAAPVSIDITLQDGAADPVGERVDLSVGQQFTMNITSDRDDEIHVHGFDTTIDVTAGQPVSRTLTVEQVGTFEVESHDPVITIVILQIR